MISLIKFNQTVIQTEECVKYIFGLLSLKEDHLKQDVKFRRVYVITRASIILGLLRVYWETGKVSHQLILPCEERIFSYGLEQPCLVPPWSVWPLPSVSTTAGPSEQLIAAVGSWSRSAASFSFSFLSVMAWAPLNIPMFTSHPDN